MRRPTRSLLLAISLPKNAHHSALRSLKIFYIFSKVGPPKNQIPCNFREEILQFAIRDIPFLRTNLAHSEAFGDPFPH